MLLRVRALEMLWQARTFRIQQGFAGGLRGHSFDFGVGIRFDSVLKCRRVVAAFEISGNVPVLMERLNSDSEHPLSDQACNLRFFSCMRFRVSDCEGFLYELETLDIEGSRCAHSGCRTDR